MTNRFSAIVAASVLLVTAPSLAQNGTTQPPQQKTPSAAETVTPEQARRALETLQDSAKRAQMIETLRVIANTPTAKTTAPSSAESGAPAAGTSTASQTAPAAAATAPEKEKAPTLSPDSLGAQLVLTIADQMGEMSRSVADAVRSITHFRGLWHWLVATITDPYSYNLLIDIAWKLALVFGVALAVAWLVRFALRRPLAALEARIARTALAPVRIDAVAEGDPVPADRESRRRRRSGMAQLWRGIARLPLALVRFALDMLPAVAFVAIAALLLSTELGDEGIPKLVILALVNAYLISRALIAAVRMLVAPPGLLAVREETAAYVEIWTRRIVTVGVFGIAFANIALMLGLHRGGHAALLRLVMLVVHLFLVVIILQCRHAVADAIRVDDGRQGFIAAARNRIAGLWHYVAIALVIALWLVWALNIRHGYALLTQYFLGTIAVAIGTRLVSMVALGLIDRGFRVPDDVKARFPGLEKRANRYLPLLRRIVSVIIAAIGVIVLLQVWGVDTMLWFYGSEIGGRLLSALITIAVAAAVAAAIWEASNAMFDRQIAQLADDGYAARAARLRTFQPMLRTTLLGVIVTIVALTALSEIGVNVAPLLAGAGIVGIAVGFGSQKLVQDLITGLFLLLENVVQVGDVVTVSGLTGVVENVSIRTIRLRAGDGAVHIVPFSAVTSVTNASRGLGNATVNVNVAYREDTDRAGAILKDIVAAMRNEPDFANFIRSDLELWGVDKIDGTMATLVGQIRCTDSGRWAVQREFNRRVKLRFQETGVELVPPSSSIIIQPAPDQPEVEPRADPASRPHAAE